MPTRHSPTKLWNLDGGQAWVLLLQRVPCAPGAVTDCSGPAWLPGRLGDSRGSFCLPGLLLMTGSIRIKFNLAGNHFPFNESRDLLFRQDKERQNGSYNVMQVSERIKLNFPSLTPDHPASSSHHHSQHTSFLSISTLKSCCTQSSLLGSVGFLSFYCQHHLPTLVVI